MNVRGVVLMAVLVSEAVCNLARAEVPQLINYQGRLLSGTNLVNGSVGLSLRLFNVQSGGAKIYEDSNSVAVVDGLYSTFIGDNTTSGSFLDALTNAAVYLEVAVNNIALSPRERLASVAYAVATAGIKAMGGNDMVINPDLNSIGTGSMYSTIGGGQMNRTGSLGYYCFIGGGYSNTIGDSVQASVVGGGSENSISMASSFCFVGSGLNNAIRDNSGGSMISGGWRNEIGNDCYSAVICGGMGNTSVASSVQAVIGGGNQNRVTGDYATVPGGDNNVATTNSFAAGHRAKAVRQGTFVWADSQNADFPATAPNQFLVRASGGVGINTNSPKGALHVNGDYYGKGHVFLHAINGDGLSGTAYLQARDDSGSSSIGLQLRTQNAGAVVNSIFISPTGTVGIGTTSPATRLHVKQAQDNSSFGADNDGLRIESASGEFWGIQTQSGGDLVFDSGLGTGYAYISKNQGTFNVTSDARFKKDVEPMTGTLDRVLRLRPVTFRYKGAPEESKPVTGFIAQDVLPLFPDVVDEKDGYFAINYGGFGPIAIAAIQELSTEVRDQKAEAARTKMATEEKIASLENAISAMNARLNALERK